MKIVVNEKEVVEIKVNKAFKTRVKALVSQIHGLKIVTLNVIKKLYPGFKAGLTLHWVNLADKLNALLEVPEPVNVNELCEMYNLTVNVKSDNLSDEYLLYSGDAFFGVIGYSHIWKQYSYAFIRTGNARKVRNLSEAYKALKFNFDDWNRKTSYGLFPA